MSTNRKTFPQMFPGAEFQQLTAQIELRDFARKYPSYIRYDEQEEILTFSTEDILFRIRHDFNEEVEVVYVGTITSFCPETVLYTTGTCSGVDIAFSRLQEGWKKVNTKTRI